MPTALITGGHAGLGYEAAKQLASRFRYNLVLAGRSMLMWIPRPSTALDYPHRCVATFRKRPR